MTADIVCADVLDWAAGYEGPQFHALLCDPPYELGFMGKDWDRSGIAFDPATWAALAEHLLPGAFGMAFASARGWHRLAVAIEDAGLRIHPSIFGWSYGSGFPKATRIDTQVDKAAGVEQETVRRTRVDGINVISPGDNGWKNSSDTSKTTIPATPLAQSWQGHRYGLQALKPALEPIIVFQKPYRGRPVDSITRTGAGALNIDGARVGVNGNDPNHRRPGGTDWGSADSDICYGAGLSGRPNENLKPEGRWPANLVLVHHPDCERVGTRRVKNMSGKASGPTCSIKGGYDTIGDFTGQRDSVPFYADPNGLETIPDWRCHESCPVRRLGEQSGERPSGGREGKYYGMGYNGGNGALNESPIRPSTGTAARFFHQSDWSLDIAERLANADPVRYQAKASRSERDAGLSGKKGFLATMGDGIGAREHNEGQPTAWVRNNHPTIKPIALARYLATLLLPPPEYAPRRLLIPFAGVMSEAIGATLAGWEHITAIEMEQEYCDIGEARLAHWASAPVQERML